MSGDAKQVALDGAKQVAQQLGVNVSAEQLELAAELFVNVVSAFGGKAWKAADAAGEVAAAKVDSVAAAVDEFNKERT